MGTGIGDALFLMNLVLSEDQWWQRSTKRQATNQQTNSRLFYPLLLGLYAGYIHLASRSEI